MVQLTNRTTNGVSFFGTTFKTTIKELNKALGKANHFGVEWELENEEKDLFCVYRMNNKLKFPEDEETVFKISGKSLYSTEIVKEEIIKLLTK